MTIVADRINQRPPLGGALCDPQTIGLTVGERDVLMLMARGHSNHGIARELFLARKTIEGRVSSIFAKFGLEESTLANRRVLAVLRFLEAEQSRTPKPA